jgi:preprotein translocase subunit YajC
MKLPFLFPLFGAAQSAGADAAAPSGMGSLISFLPIVLIFGVFYFFMIRPQSKRQKDTQKMLSAIKKGDRVVTIGGFHGVVSSVKETTVILKIDDSTKVELSRSAISQVLGEGSLKNEDRREERKIEGKKGDDAEDTDEDAPRAE